MQNYCFFLNYQIYCNYFFVFPLFFFTPWYRSSQNIEHTLLYYIEPAEKIHKEWWRPMRERGTTAADPNKNGQGKSHLNPIRENGNGKRCRLFSGYWFRNNSDFHHHILCSAKLDYRETPSGNFHSRNGNGKKAAKIRTSSGFAKGILW